MQVEHILSLLDGVHRSGRGWAARCPGHIDNSPSLCVGEGERGVLLHCQAGCTFDEVCLALGVRKCDLFFDRAMPRAPRLPSSQSFRPDRLRIALKFELHADKLMERAQAVLKAARDLNCVAWNDGEFNAAVVAVAQAYHDFAYADVLFNLADLQRLKAYEVRR